MDSRNLESASINIYMDDVRAGPVDKDWIIVRSVEFVKFLLQTGLVNDMSLDHDMGDDQESGYDLVKFMAAENLWPKGDIVVHSANPVGAENMRCVIDTNFYAKTRY